MNDIAAAMPAIRRARNTASGAVVVTIVRNESHIAVVAQQRCVVRANGDVDGGFPAVIHDLLVRDAAATIVQGTSRLRSYSVSEDVISPARLQQGQLDVYFDLLPRPARLIVVGGGHIALPLVDIGNILEFKVTVIDDRPEFANPTRFPSAATVLCGTYDSTLAGLDVDEATYIVLVTRGHVHDATCLRHVLETPAAYIGMIGSNIRARRVLDTLRVEGYDDLRLESIHAPIGLDIGSTTPAEIAVAIAAEIVNVRRGGNGISLRESRK